MSRITRSGLRLVGVVALGGAVTLGAKLAGAQERPTPARGARTAFTVDAQMALRSLMSLSDAHLQKLADVLSILAA